jgi:acyl-CoA reductase-like NAD-dependent aldehyde dehydrogenase
VKLVWSTKIQKIFNRTKMSVDDKLVVVQNFINGHFEADATSYLDSYEPGSGQVWARIPDSDGQIVDRAVSAAKKAFKGWKSLSVSKRAEYLIKAANVLESRLEEFAVAESRDQV